MSNPAPPTINFAIHPSDVPVSALNGPGKRFAIWMQGCKLRCTTECISPQLLEVRPRHVVGVAEAWEVLEARARAHGEAIEGLTFLGGEPTEQAAPLAVLAASARRHGWSVVTYTGHTIEAIRRRQCPDVAALLAETDILIDGPYLPRLSDPMLRWRGSSNQRILLLSDRYTMAQIESLPLQKGTDLTITSDRRLIITGMQDREMVVKLEDSLRRKGLIE